MTQTDPQEAAYARVLAYWASLARETDPVPAWEQAFAAMVREVDEARAENRWRSGGRTLLHALGLHHDEVRMCRGLAWLLTPDGWHRLGDGFLRRFLVWSGVEESDLSSAVILVEEARGETRADMVIRVGSSTVLVEAKIWAGEQGRQADRLAERWAEESPRLVFLTRDGRLPYTAVDSAGEWLALSWPEVGTLLAESVSESENHAVGVLEFLETIEHYGG